MQHSIVSENTWDCCRATGIMYFSCVRVHVALHEDCGVHVTRKVLDVLRTLAGATVLFHLCAGADLSSDWLPSLMI